MQPNVTLRQLRAFVLLAQTGKFTLAAQRMHITQSALSTLVKELEQGVGARLFDRHTRMVEMTAAGADFYLVAQKLLDDLDTAVAGMGDLAALRNGRVSIVASTVISASLLSGAFKAFRGLHPGVQFVLRDVAEEEILRVVASGTVDFGIGTFLDADGDIAESHLFDDGFLALCAPEHPLARKRRIRWRDLQGEPFIALAPGSPIRRLLDDTMAREGLRMNVVNEVSFSTTVLSLVSAGVGVSVLPMNNHPYLRGFDVHAAPLVSPSVTRRISIFTKRRRSLSPAAGAFIEFLHAQVRRPAGNAPPAAGGR